MNGLFHILFPILNLQNLVCILHVQLISVLTGHVSSARDLRELVDTASDRAGPSTGRCQPWPAQVEGKHGGMRVAPGEARLSGFNFGADIRKARLYRPTPGSQERALPSPPNTHTRHTHTHPG